MIKLAWSVFDECYNFFGKKLKNIKHDFGEGRIIFYFDDDTEIRIDAIIEKDRKFPNLEVEIIQPIENKFII